MSPRARRTKAQKKPSAKPGPKPGAAGRALRIRMYNVGFGDSFLLTVPAPDRDRKILIDCGVHPSGPGPRKIADVAQQIVADVREGGTPRIDVVICTHRHADHVSGFDDEIWKGVEVSEVWMPWTEDPTDPEARRIRESQSKAATHLTALAAQPGLAAQPTVAALAANALTNAGAMSTLHDGFSGSPARRFLPGPDRAKATFTTDVLPGVKVHVMGPSRDADVIRDMNPPADEHYLRLAGGGGETGQKPTPPFDTSWAVPASAVSPAARLSKADVADLGKLSDVDALALAVALDQAVNGTSLLIMLQVGRSYLLLPGDAQWGTWRNAMADPEWRALLGQTSFYKVGHHGSHNATPKQLVEQILANDFYAMVSTRAHTKTWDIPRGPLLTALRKKSNRVARSDDADVPDATGFVRDGTKQVDLKLPV